MYLSFIFLLYVYLAIHLSTYRFMIYLSSCLSVYLSLYLTISLPLYFSISLSVYLYPYPTHIHLHLHLSVCLPACLQVFFSTARVSVSVCPIVFIRLSTCTYSHACMNTFIRTLYMHMHIHIQTHTYIYIYIYTHTSIHMYTHTCACELRADDLSSMHLQLSAFGEALSLSPPIETLHYVYAITR